MSNGQVYRYDTSQTHDGLPGGEGTFNICTFWLVEAMTRAGRHDPRRLDEARLLFERMLGYANHLGLYAEQTGPSGEALGNFPQAFTHISLISAAFNLDRALGAVFGAVRAGVLVLALAVVVHLVGARDAPWWRESVSAGVATAALRGWKTVLRENLGKYMKD